MTCGHCLGNAKPYHFTTSAGAMFPGTPQGTRPALVHWEVTYEEVRASGRFTDRGDHAARPNPICRNGSFHAITTRDRARVDCPVCLEAMP